MFPTLACKSASVWEGITWLQRTSVYVCVCVCVCVCAYAYACACASATPSFINEEWQTVYRETYTEGVRDEIAFSAPLLMTFTLSNGTEQGLLHTATYSTTACTARNIGDPNLNRTHNWITSDDTSFLEFRLVQCLSFLFSFLEQTVPPRYCHGMAFWEETVETFTFTAEFFTYRFMTADILTGHSRKSTGVTNNIIDRSVLF